ncbi:MAG: cell division protein SepF [Acidimicrobiales bacterium]
MPANRSSVRSPEPDHSGLGYDAGFNPDPGASAVSSVRPLRPVPSPELDDDWSRSTESVERSNGRSRTATSGAGQHDLLDLDAEEARSLSGRNAGSHDRYPGDRQRNEPVVRPVPIQRTKPRALTPKTFADAKVLADDIKGSVPVVMNLREADRDLARRLIDFASGVCYSLDASMEKLASQVFLLTPASVEVSGEERRCIEERGFDR